MKSFRYYYLLMVLIVCSIQANAQLKLITGYIYDSQSRQTLEGVLIQNQENDILTQSNNKGYFEFKPQTSDSLFKVSIIGFKSQWVKLRQRDNHFNIQLEADAVNLNEVRVTGFNGDKSNKETAGSIGLITSSDIERGNGVSLQPALNSIAGVKMEQSTLSEARISIRGNGVRASYGIRNIKIYVNDIPITEADGTTRIEALDINSIGRAEVIKGPASSIYGAGVGGVINFQLQRSPYQEQSTELNSEIGTFGLHRLSTTYKNGGDKMNSYISLGWHEYDGYREHSNDMRRFMTANFQLFPDDKRIITLLLNRTTQHSQIPGALNREQYQVDPKQANASNMDKAAGRYQNWTRVGLGQRYQFNDHFSNSSSIFTYFYDLDHPLPYAYLRNYYQSYGGRTRFSYHANFAFLPTTFSAGAEFNEGLTKGSQFVNNQGKEGEINSTIDYNNKNFSLFYQSETEITEKTHFILGLSYTSMSYDVKNYLNESQTGIKKFDPQVSPRVALSHNFNEALSLHASVSSGFSPPSSSEIKNVDGSINPKIQAEKAINYEINAKGNFLKSRITYDLSLFKMDMKGELITQSVQQGITIYNNSGKTSHNGIELALSYQVLKEEDNNFIQSLRPFTAITYSDFKFKDYKKLNATNEIIENYDGNVLTGIAPWVIMGGLELKTKMGLYFYGSYYYNDKIFLNDANTDFHASYHVVNTKIGFNQQLSKSFIIDIHGGVDNLLNKKYSSILSLNAVGFGGAQPAYFNPSPSRNGYVGINIKHLL